jgi:hypothetical protein
VLDPSIKETPCIYQSRINEHDGASCNFSGVCYVGASSGMSAGAPIIQISVIFLRQSDSELVSHIVTTARDNGSIVT